MRERMGKYCQRAMRYWWMVVVVVVEKKVGWPWRWKGRIIRQVGRRKERIIVTGRMWRSMVGMDRAVAADAKGLGWDIGEVSMWRKR